MLVFNENSSEISSACTHTEAHFRFLERFLEVLGGVHTVSADLEPLMEVTRV